MLITLDANIWIAERLLHSSLGAALLYALKRKHGEILLPSATRAKVVAGCVLAGERALNDIQSGFGLIQVLKGERPDIALPSAQDFGDFALARIEELGGVIRPIDHTTEQMQAALERVIAHRPPAHKKEEYRDGFSGKSLVRPQLKGRLALFRAMRLFSKEASLRMGLPANSERTLIMAARRLIFTHPWNIS